MASQVLITAEMLWGSATFSNTTVIFGCRLFSTLLSLSLLSGVIAANIMLSAERHPAAKSLFKSLQKKKLPGKPGTALTGNDQNKFMVGRKKFLTANCCQ